MIITFKDKMVVVTHQTEAQYHHIILQHAQRNIIHCRHKILSRVKNIIFLQRFTANMIVLFYNHYCFIIIIVLLPPNLRTTTHVCNRAQSGFSFSYKHFFFFIYRLCRHQARLYSKSVADTRLNGRICHAFAVFPWKMFANEHLPSSNLFCKSKLLHKRLWLRIVTAEVAVKHVCILDATLRKDVLTE